MSEVREQIGAALELLIKDLPGVVDAVLEDKCFCAVIEDVDTYKLRGDSYFPVSKSYVVVDFTQRMVYDEQRYLGIGMGLFNLFSSVKTWYEC